MVVGWCSLSFLGDWILDLGEFGVMWCVFCEIPFFFSQFSAFFFPFSFEHSRNLTF